MEVAEKVGGTVLRADKVRSAKRQIDKYIKDLAGQMRKGNSEQMERLLHYIAQFHHYSLRNICLAMMQRPDITRLAGLRQWNKVGRRVKRGERGIMILAPVTVRENRTEPEADEGAGSETETIKPKAQTGKIIFIPVYVFDVGQTEGQELPQVVHAQGDVSRLWPAMQLLVKHAAIQLDFADVIGNRPSAAGVSLGGRIILKRNLSDADAFRTLVHEYAHELLHHRSGVSERRIRETEADATAYVVCRHFGLECDTSDYLLLYDAKPELLYARLEKIRHSANLIIDGLEADPSQSNEANEKQ